MSPSVRHGDLIFCFIYKFRQRLAVVGNAIAQRLGIDPTPLEAYRREGLFLDDFYSPNRFKFALEQRLKTKWVLGDRPKIDSAVDIASYKIGDR